MSTITKILSSATSSKNLRAFDARRDLKDVADLVESCFAETLDHDGRRYLQQMRSAAGNPAYLRWAVAAAERTRMPLTGYVWEEDERLVGNLTLIPYYSLGKRYYLIANVAVHQDYRRRGIALQLTYQALQHAVQRGAQAVWLHVRAENQGAINLYQGAGFTEQARRTTWYWEKLNRTIEPLSTMERKPTSPVIVLGNRRAYDWNQHRAWLRQTYPAEINWHLSLRMAAVQPGLWGFLYRTVNNYNMRHWSARQNSHLVGVLSWQASYTYADNLWLVVKPGAGSGVVEELLAYGRAQLSERRPLALDYPADLERDAIHKAGFHPHQTLIWMSVNLP